MTQRVNLYTQDLMPRNEPLQFQLAAVAVLAVLLLGALGAGYAQWQASNAGQVATRVAQQLQTARDHLDAITKTVEARHQDPALQADVARLTERLQAHREVLQQISHINAQSSVGFSGYLVALSNQALPGIWLDGFMVESLVGRPVSSAVGASQTELVISGLAKRGDLLPVYLQRLQSEAVFKGRLFEYLQMQREEKPASGLHFELRTLPADSKAVSLRSTTSQSRIQREFRGAP